MTNRDLVGAEWRVGRKVGRTMYAAVGPEPSDRDILIGMMDTRELAQAAVHAHNQTRHLFATARGENLTHDDDAP